MEPRFGHDFSRVSIRSLIPTWTKPTFALGTSGDIDEQGADPVGKENMLVGAATIDSPTGAKNTDADEGERDYEAAHRKTLAKGEMDDQMAASPIERGEEIEEPQSAESEELQVGVPHAVTTSVSEDGAASQRLGRCDWGLTWPEKVDETISAVKSGDRWRADLTDLKGHYSKQTRLLPSEKEVTGPGGNTTASNFCDQVGELGRLGDCPGAWYVAAAVIAHENVHAAHMSPALMAAAPDIQADFNRVTVRDDVGKTEVGALSEIQARRRYSRVKRRMWGRWFDELFVLGQPDHAGPTAAAEHGVVDPLSKTICDHATAMKWGSCAQCPP